MSFKKFRIKLCFALLSGLIALSLPYAANAKGGSGHHSNQQGTYMGGHGSSHSGGHYLNPRTASHYNRLKKS
jgi:hypothetical protein